MIRALLVVAVLVGVAACGDDEPPVQTEPADFDFHADISQVGSSVRISWSVTNRTDSPMVVTDGRKPEQTDDVERAGAYVVRGPNGTAEIARRVFPVPEDLEGVQQYGILGSLLEPGANRTGNEIVILPLEYHPAATKGGGDPLPATVERVTFCLGVLPAGDDSSPNRFVRHTPANEQQQQQLCSEPYDLTST